MRRLFLHRHRSVAVFGDRAARGSDVPPRGAHQPQGLRARPPGQEDPEPDHADAAVRRRLLPAARPRHSARHLFVARHSRRLAVKYC